MRASDREWAQLPREGGLYVLVLRRSGGAFRARVGALGVLSFRPGYYCYVGSARAGLRARLLRHLRRDRKRKRWHIDYLRERTRPVAVLTRADGSECALSRAVGRLAAETIARFGSADCRCAGHLHYFESDPTELLGALRLERPRSRPEPEKEGDGTGPSPDVLCV